MATVKQLQDLKKTLEKQIDKLIASIPTDAADAARAEDTEDEPEKGDVKLTPIQKLEKQKETANEKLTKLNEKIAGGKSKIPDKDAENKTKLEEVISKFDEKITEAQAKEAKKAAKPAPAKAKAEKAPEKAPETAPKAEKAEEAKKHVPRITPAMTTKLKEAFETASAEWDDKYKKEFVTQVNSLSDEQFAEFALEGHMSRFANTHAPAAGGGGAAAPKPKSLTVAELVKQNKNLKQVSPGVFQHKTTGEMVTGPAEDADEEFEEKKHDGDDYIVGETTKRVYKPCEDGPDEFVGYWGVGEW
jgi:DNA repair exonuclease SbcCD ATPase subunit